MPLNVILDKPALSSGRGRRSRGRRGSKIAQLVDRGTPGQGDQNILDLEIPVQQGRLEIVHARYPFGDIREDGQDLGLRQPVLQPRVHEVDETPSGAVLHEEKDLVAAALELGGMGVNIGDDVPVALQLLHCFHLGPHVGQRGLVRDRDSLEDGDIRTIDDLGEADDIDMGESTFGKVLLYDNAMAADLHFGPRQERASWRCGGAHWRAGIVGGRMAGRIGLLRIRLCLGMVRGHDVAADALTGYREIADSEVIVTA